MKYLIYNIKYNIKSVSPKYLLTEESEQIKNITDEINNLVDSLDDGGLLFICGIPFVTGQICNQLKNFMTFKYWIACELNPMENNNDLPLSHYGVVFYQKNIKKTNPFNLKTFEFRVPHTNCPSCVKMTKDWGGKKHMLNPKGVAYSDVWEINKPLRLKSNNLIPEILNTIKGLVEFPEELMYLDSTIIYDDTLKNITNEYSDYVEINEYEFDNKILNVDCNEFVDNIVKEYPDGIYDIAFSDPPYNLNKNYSKYEDNLRDSEYLDWCE
jgi:site-specific DNA-methyltransferase (adenine-specific)